LAYPDASAPPSYRWAILVLDALDGLMSKVRSWKLWLGVLGSGFGLTAAVTLWVYHATETAWSHLGTEIDRLIEAETRRRPERPHLRPLESSGNAWNEYLLAIEAAKPLRQEGHLLAYWYSPTPAKHSKVLQVLQTHAPLLDQFHHATSAATLVPARLPEDLREYDRLHEGWDLAMLVLSDARISLDKGDSKRGTDRLIDLLQFTRDWVECGSIEKVRTSHAYVRDTVLEIARALEGGRIGPGEMETLRNALQVLDERPPSRAMALRRRVIQLGATLHARGMEGATGRDLSAAGISPGLRDLYSRRRQALRTFSEARRLLYGVDPIDDWTLAQETEFFTTFQAQFPVHPHHLRAEFDHLCNLMRINHTWIRLGRVALHWKLTGTQLSLNDPFAPAPLRTRITNKCLEVWSVGYAGNAGPDDPYAMVFRVPK
jgi:hypothetical protein